MRLILHRTKRTKQIYCLLLVVYLVLFATEADVILLPQLLMCRVCAGAKKKNDKKSPYVLSDRNTRSIQ